MQAECHPQLKRVARGLCSSCYKKVLKMKKALLPKSKISTEDAFYNMIALQWEKVREKLPLLYEKQDMFFSKISKTGFKGEYFTDVKRFKDSKSAESDNVKF